MYVFTGVPASHPMTLVKGDVGNCTPQLVSATQQSGFAYYGEVRYSFASCSLGDQVLFLSQDNGFMSQGAPALKVDPGLC